MIPPENTVTQDTIPAAQERDFPRGLDPSTRDGGYLSRAPICRIKESGIGERSHFPLFDPLRGVPIGNKKATKAVATESPAEGTRNPAPDTGFVVGAAGT